MRRIALAAGLLVAAALVAAAAGLAAARREMAALEPPLPSPEALAAFADAAALPVRIGWIETAVQRAPRSLVLDAARDPAPATPYVMGHPVFVVEWADGRRLLVDAGMEPAGARAFGRPLEWLGAAPIEPAGAAADLLGPSLAEGAPVGLLFTHLHVDHVGGVSELCRARGAGPPLRLFQREAQATRANYTTRPARALLDGAPCLARERLAEAAAAPVPGFPGAFVVHAAGHTPGSQIVGVFLREGAAPRGVLLAGDVANAWDGVVHDVPKPAWYRLAIVPEHEPRQRRLRRFLREAVDRGFTVVVSHDRRALEASGLPERVRAPAADAQE